MRFLVVLLYITFSCTNHSDAILLKLQLPVEILDSVRIKSNSACIVFHHQVQKISFVSKVIYTRQGIDSIFEYIGEVNADTTCLQGGLYNYFGEIDLYSDSSREDKIAEIHFVLQGDCSGFYLQTKKYLKRYKMTLEAKEFLTKLYNANKDKLR